MTKILHFADLHGTDKHIVEIEKNTDFMIDVAKKENPDLIVCAGDVTDSKNTKMGSITSLILVKQFEKMADIAPIIIVLGTDSHDGLTPVILESIKGEYPIYVSQRPEQIAFYDKDFTLLSEWDEMSKGYNPDAIITTCPTPTKKYFHTDSGIDGSNDEIGHNLGVMFAGFGANLNNYVSPNCYKIFVGHFSVDGAKISETQTMIGRDIGVSKEQLRALNCHLICLGHIHKWQFFLISEFCKAFYSGGFYRKTFGEPEEKGFYIHEQEKESRFIALPAIRRDCYDFDFTDVDPEKEELMFENSGFDFNKIILADFNNIENPVGFNNTEIKIRYKIWQDHAIRINKTVIKDFIISNGALDCKLEPNVIPREIVRNNEVNEVESVAEKIEVLAKHDNRTVEQSILDRISDLEGGSSYQELIDKYSIKQDDIDALKMFSDQVCGKELKEGSV